MIDLCFSGITIFLWISWGYEDDISGQKLISDYLYNPIDLSKIINYCDYVPKTLSTEKGKIDTRECSCRLTPYAYKALLESDKTLPYFNTSLGLPMHLGISKLLLVDILGITAQAFLLTSSSVYKNTQSTIGQDYYS